MTTSRVTSSKNKDNYLILQEKLQKLEKDYLETKEKLKIYGSKDISENSDWVLLNEKLSICRNQINQLKVKMEDLSLEKDKIIIYQLLETGEEKTIQLTNGEIDPEQGKISRVSPLGELLDNKKVGQVVEVKINAQKYQIKIIGVKNL
ncbi:MAG: GreA/GreB family elongation factor [Spiroplasmataceae bacterium]|jgi:transcription elongation GreA/GreB family factor|nr:GreA/GreB family elongation factor [Spiroplasmataceae bacterium]